MEVKTLTEVSEVKTRFIDYNLICEIVEDVKKDLVNSLECKTVNEDEPIFIHIKINLKDN